MGEPIKRPPTLWTFVEQSIARGEIPSRGDAYVRGFSSLYVRLTTRFVDGERLWPVLDIARIEAVQPGKGAFTKLIAKLHETFPHVHIYVEEAHERFGNYLVEKLGFQRLDPQIHGNSFILKAKGRSWVTATKT